MNIKLILSIFCALFTPTESIHTKPNVLLSSYTLMIRLVALRITILFAIGIQPSLAIDDSSFCQSEFQEYTREQFVNEFICNDPNTMESINRQICDTQTSNCFRCHDVVPRFSAKHHSHILQNGKLRIQSHCVPKPTYAFDDHAAGEQCNQLIKKQLTCSSGDRLTEELCEIRPDLLFQGAVFGPSRVHRTNFNCCRKKLQDGTTPQCHTKREPVSITLHIVKNSTIGPTRRRSRRKQRRNYSGGHKETIREEIQFYLPSSCCAIL